MADVKPIDVMAALKACAEHHRKQYPDASDLMLEAAELIDKLCLDCADLERSKK